MLQFGRSIPGAVGVAGGDGRPSEVDEEGVGEPRVRQFSGQAIDGRRSHGEQTTWVPDFVLCRVAQLVEGRGRPARAGDRYLAVFLVDGKIHVLDNQCAHVGSPLDAGPVIDGAVRCPWHGWAYDLETGTHLTAFGPRPGIEVYPVSVNDRGEVQVSIAERVGD